MTLRELQYLIAVAEYRHFGHAADACHVSQPTLSTQLKKLEASLGVTLFERNNKTLQITRIGEQVVEKARTVLAEAESIIDLTRAEGSPLSGRLRLGIIPTLSPYMLPWLLPALRDNYPDLELVINEEMTDPLIGLLKTHDLDAALLALPIDGPGLHSRAIFDEPFVFACPGDHPLAKQTHIAEKQLRDVQLLLLTDGHCLRRQALAVCGLASESRKRVADFRAASLETIRQLVIAGQGCTLLPVMAQGDTSDDRIAIRPLESRASRTIGLVWRENYSKVDDLKLLAQLISGILPDDLHAV